MQYNPDPVVRSLDNTIHRININPVDNAENFVNTFHWMVIYLLDSVMRPLNKCFQMNTRDHGARTCDIKNALYLASSVRDTFWLVVR